MRTEFSTVLETTLTEVASGVPAQWSASVPQVPILCSVTPVELTTIVYGWSSICIALKPTPNQAPAGPLSVMVACLAAAASEMPTLTLVLGEEEAASLVSAEAQEPEPPVLKSAVAEPSGFLSSTQPAGIFGSLAVFLVVWVALKPSASMASKQACAFLKAWPWVQLPLGMAWKAAVSFFEPASG